VAGLRLRIVHTESSLGWGGQELRILAEAEGLARRGHTVRIVCPQEARLYREAQARGIDVRALPIARKRVPALAALAAALRAEAPQVLCTHSSTDSWLGALAARVLRGPPAIVRVRHISAPVPRNALSRWLYRQAARVVTTGEALRRELIARLGLDPARVVSVPTGADPARFRPGDRRAARARLGLPAEAFVVGVVATLRSWKGHRYLVEAIGRLPERFQLLVVGDGPQREPLAAQIAALGLERRVHLVGERADVLPWLHALDAFALPSYANEGVPQALVQAMLVGLPSVVTLAGAIDELAAHERTALVVPPRNAHALAEALARLAADSALAREMGEAARRHCVENHTLERMLDRMEALYLEVTRRPAGGPRA